MFKFTTLALLALTSILPAQTGVAHVPGSTNCQAFGGPELFLGLSESVDSSRDTLFAWHTIGLPFPAPTYYGVFRLSAFLSGPVQIPRINCAWYMAPDTLHVAVVNTPLTYWATIPQGILPQGFTFYSQAAYYSVSTLRVLSVTPAISITVQ